MDDAPPSPPPRFRRRWARFVNVVVALWLATLLVVFLHADWPVWHFLPQAWWAPLKFALFWVFPLFVLNLYLQYRWSLLTRRQFMRKRWLDILMVVPVFRGLMFLRLFQVGRVGVVLRVGNHVRRSVGLARKGKRHGAKAVQVVRAKAVLNQAGAGDTPGSVVGAAEEKVGEEVPAAPDAAPGPTR